MAYGGYLIKIGSGGSAYTVPLEYILMKTYKCTYSTLDLDSYRNANGALVRNAIARVPHCTFTLRSLTDTQMSGFWSAIAAQFAVNLERKVYATVFVPELNDYVSDYFYFPDTDFTIMTVSETSVKYDELPVELIGYGEQ